MIDGVNLVIHKAGHLIFSPFGEFQLGVDGIVFATAEERWKPGTQGRIEALRSKFKGEVLILTKAELFEKQHSKHS